MTTGVGGAVGRGWPRRGPRPATARFEGSLALVTGAGSGIGRATAELLARRGASVIAADIDGDAARAVAGAWDGTAVQVDVADQGAMTDLATIVESRHGPLDVPVNNAGVGLSGRFLDTTTDDWDWILGVNLLGAVHGCRAFGPAMVARGHGHVVNVSSALGYFPRATEPAYVTTKAGVLALSRCLRADWAGAGVGVSAVCPGVVATAIVEHARFRGERARPETVQKVRDTFRRRGLAPARVAAAIADAVVHNRSVVPVGIDAWVGWLLAGVVPAKAGDRLAVLGGV